MEQPDDSQQQLQQQQPPPFDSVAMQRQCSNNGETHSHDGVSTLTSTGLCEAVATSVRSNHHNSQHIAVSVVEVVEDDEEQAPVVRIENGMAASNQRTSPILVEAYHPISVQEVVVPHDNDLGSTIDTLDEPVQHNIGARRVLTCTMKRSAVWSLALPGLVILLVAVLVPTCWLTDRCGGSDTDDSTMKPILRHTQYTILYPECKEYYTTLLDDLNKNELFAFSFLDARLNYTGGHQVGEYCYVGSGFGNRYCRYYVYSKPSNSTGYEGWPRNVRDEGTGCVSYNASYCWYTAAEYENWPFSERMELCAANETQNAAAQLRHAIVNNACGSCNATQQQELNEWLVHHR